MLGTPWKEGSKVFVDGKDAALNAKFLPTPMRIHLFRVRRTWFQRDKLTLSTPVDENVFV